MFSLKSLPLFILAICISSFLNVQLLAIRGQKIGLLSRKTQKAIVYYIDYIGSEEDDDFLHFNR